MIKKSLFLILFLFSTVLVHPIFDEKSKLCLFQGFSNYSSSQNKREYTHNYYEKNKEKWYGYYLKSKLNRGDEITAKNKQYRIDNAIKIAFMKSINYILHSDYYTIYRIIDYEINGEKRLAAERLRKKQPEVKKRDNIRRQKTQQEKLEKLMLRITGGEAPHCIECGEDDKDKLVLDHINNGGKIERNGINKLQWIRRWLKCSDQEIREHLQILCASCNHKKEMLRRRGGD